MSLDVIETLLCYCAVHDWWESCEHVESMSAWCNPAPPPALETCAEEGALGHGKRDGITRRVKKCRPTYDVDDSGDEDVENGEESGEVRTNGEAAVRVPGCVSPPASHGHVYGGGGGTNAVGESSFHDFSRSNGTAMSLDDLAERLSTLVDSSVDGVGGVDESALEGGFVVGLREAVLESVELDIDDERGKLQGKQEVEGGDECLQSDDDLPSQLISRFDHLPLPDDRKEIEKSLLACDDRALVYVRPPSRDLIQGSSGSMPPVGLRQEAKRNEEETWESRTVNTYDSDETFDSRSASRASRGPGDGSALGDFVGVWERGMRMVKDAWGKASLMWLMEHQTNQPVDYVGVLWPVLRRCHACVVKANLWDQLSSASGQQVDGTLQQSDYRLEYAWSSKKSLQELRERVIDAVCQEKRVKSPDGEGDAVVAISGVDSESESDDDEDNDVRWRVGASCTVRRWQDVADPIYSASACSSDIFPQAPGVSGKAEPRHLGSAVLCLAELVQVADAHDKAAQVGDAVDKDVTARWKTGEDCTLFCDMLRYMRRAFAGSDDGAIVPSSVQQIAIQVASAITRVLKLLCRVHWWRSAVTAPLLEEVSAWLAILLRCDDGGVSYGIREYMGLLLNVAHDATMVRSLHVSNCLDGVCRGFETVLGHFARLRQAMRDKVEPLVAIVMLESAVAILEVIRIMAGVVMCVSYRETGCNLLLQRDDGVICMLIVSALEELSRLMFETLGDKDIKAASGSKVGGGDTSDDAQGVQRRVLGGWQRAVQTVLDALQNMSSSSMLVGEVLKTSNVPAVLVALLHCASIGMVLRGNGLLEKGREAHVFCQDDPAWCRTMWFRMVACEALVDSRSSIVRSLQNLSREPEVRRIIVEGSVSDFADGVDAAWGQARYDPR